MNDNPAEQIGLLLRSGSSVGAAAAALGLVCWLVMKTRGEAICPRWKMPPFVWPGPFIFGFFFAYLLVSLFIVPVLIQSGVLDRCIGRWLPAIDPGNPDVTQILNHLKSMWAGFIFVPTLLLVAFAIRSTILATPVGWSAEWRAIPRTLLLGILVFGTFGVAAQVLNVLLGFLWHWFGWTLTEHPLSKMGLSGDGVGGVVFVLGACVTAPILEEFLFRGLLVSWASGRWYRPWVLMGFTLMISWGGAVGSLNIPATVFAVMLMLLLMILQRYTKSCKARFPSRTASAVWSSSALFALFHSSVWPTPIPLFVLALGLGFVTARTRSWWPAAFAHAVFNTVSTVAVGLRG